MEHADETPAEPNHIPLMVSQFLTEGVMRERLAELGHRSEFGCELVGLKQDEDGVTARLASKAAKETVGYATSSSPMAAAASCAMRSTSAFPARPSAFVPSSPTSH